MPLTRNLYEMDEVVAALQLSLRNGWPQASFWLWELVVSKEEELARTTLTDVWLRWGGGYYTEYLTSAKWEERAALVVAAIKKAGSMNADRFLSETATMPDRPHMTPLPATPQIAERRKRLSAAFVATLDPAEALSPNESANFWISLDAACRQGHRLDAVWLLQASPLSEDAIWSALFISAEAEKLDAIRLLRDIGHPLSLTVAILRLCMRDSQQEPVCGKPWSWMEGRRQSRQHAIPAQALHEETTRGQISYKYTNIGDIREPVPLLSEGCRFWQEALERHGVSVNPETGATVFPDDESLEAFHDEYFPDDIPDEWSRADQEKSHGRGYQEAAPSLVPIQIREEPVSRRAWNCAIHVRKS